MKIYLPNGRGGTTLHAGLADLGEDHLHRGHPVSILVEALVVSSLCVAVFAEHRGAAGVGVLEDPGFAVEDQLASARVALAVEEVDRYLRLAVS